MIFNSLLFGAFFAIVLLVHYSPLPALVRKFGLLTANLLFFASYHPPYVLLLVASTIIDWLLANRIDKAEGRARKLWLCGSILLNMGVLCFFKYADFALENMQLLLAHYGIAYEAPKFSLIIPVGISFYTFQALSYTIDVYRRIIKPEPSLLNFAMFVSFFPHLVAGPILRARDILPQCQQLHRAKPAEFFWGLNLLTWGLFQKVILADQIFAPVSDALFKTGMKLTMLEGWAAALAFTCQIFFDFAGYSTCAIGVALCLGFYIPDNFRFPYGAFGFSDFWRRWHISLSSWLRDYLYIPLGGNKKGVIRTQINLVLTMLLGGLWHGAAWHYVLWGAWHGALLMVERIFQPATGFVGRKIPALSIIGWLITIYAVVIGWVMFRATDVIHARNIFQTMHDTPSMAVKNLPLSQVILTLSAAAFVILLQLLLRKQTAESIFSKTPEWLSGVLFGFMILAIALFAGKATGFIYFQF